MKKVKAVIKTVEMKSKGKSEGRPDDLTLANINKRIWERKLERLCLEVNGKGLGKKGK